MTKEEENKLFNIRCRSKRGEYVSIEENMFCKTMHMKYKDEYKLMDRKVFLATAPFGSKI
jgi:hypothetical protein